MDTGTPVVKQAIVQRSSVWPRKEGTVSGLSVAHYFPWRRVKIVYQNVNAEPPSALIRVEPDQRLPAGGGATRLDADDIGEVAE